MKLLPCVARIINQRLGGLGICAKLLGMAWLLSLSACSLVATGYNNGPRLIMFAWVNPHLDLTKVQERQVLADLEHIQTWHRQQQLPLYLHWLQEMQALAPQNIQAAQVCKLFDEMRDSLMPLAMQLEEPTARLALSLQSDQLTHLNKRFEKENKKWRQEWQLDGSLEDQLEVQTDKGQDNAEHVYGRLDRSQKNLLRQLAKDSGFDGPKTAAERSRQQSDAYQVLQAIASKQPPLKEAKVMVHDWLERSLHTPDPVYAAYLKKRLQTNCEAAATFHNTTTKEQRQHAVNLLKGYENDVRNMMRTPG